MRLDEKAAIVTGAGRGIGRATALALTRKGVVGVLAARTRAEIEVVVDEMSGPAGRAARRRRLQIATHPRWLQDGTRTCPIPLAVHP